MYRYLAPVTLQGISFLYTAVGHLRLNPLCIYISLYLPRRPRTAFAVVSSEESIQIRCFGDTQMPTRKPARSRLHS